jgi:hypothetical protein
MEGTLVDAVESRTRAVAYYGCIELSDARFHKGTGLWAEEVRCKEE